MEHARTQASSEPSPDLVLSFLEGLPLTQAATELARERHAGQRRDGDHPRF